MLLLIWSCILCSLIWHTYTSYRGYYPVKFTNGGLSFSLFYSHFLFLFFLIYFLTFLFLEHKVRISDGHESRDVWNKVEGSRTSNVIQHGYHMLTSCTIYDCLG